MTQPIPLHLPLIIDKAMNAGTITSLPEADALAFPEIMLLFKEKAFALKETGAQMLFIEEMATLPELRAAVIASKKTALPLFVIADMGNEDITEACARALALLICLQELGIAAFGVKHSSDPAAIIAELYPYAKIPLLARACEDVSVAEMLEGGAECFDLREGKDTTLAIWKNTVESFDFIGLGVKKADTSLVLSGEAQAFFLSADNIECSEALTCSMDMADELLDFSASSFDLITVDVHTTDDAYDFSKNAHMASRPILFHSDSDIALKAALLTYHGRAMVDTHCGIDEEALEKIAEKYGAVLY